MIEFVRFTVALAATSFAAWRSWRHPHLFIYFAANLLYEIVTEWPLVHLGDQSATYVYTYAAFTAIWLLSALAIVWEAISAYSYRLRRMALFALTAIVLTRFVFVGIHRHLDFSDWVVLCEGSVLYMAGFALACVSFFSGKRADTYFILAILWLCQAGFFWSWLLSLPEAGWIEAGWIIPTALCSMAFLLVGLGLRPIESAQGRGGRASRHPI